MSITSRSLTSLGAKILVGATALAGGFVGVPAGTSHAYNPGVNSLDFAGVIDTCLPGQALPCTPGAGQGESNTIRVTQSMVDGYHQFNGLASNATHPDDIWLGAEIGADCRAGYSLWKAEISNEGGSGDGMYYAWEIAHEWTSISVPDANSMPVKRVAVNWSIDGTFTETMKQELFDFGEDVIADRMANGMSAAAARALPFDAEGTLILTGKVVCRGNNGAHFKYEKWQSIEVPLSIEFEGANVPAPIGGQTRSGGLTMAAEVTDVELAVVTDPADPCTVHLSATILTNGETSVDYRFVGPNGQRSSTYTVEVGASNTAFVNLPVDVPSSSTAPPSPGGLSNKAVAVDPDTWSGVFTIQVMSPNQESDAEGFAVPYCVGPQFRN